MPAVEAGGLAISGVDLAAADDSPAPPQSSAASSGPASEVQVYHAGQPIAYRVEVYNLRFPAGGAVHTELQMVFFHEGKMVGANDPVDIVLRPAEDPRRTPMAGRIVLPAGLPPGHYVMRFSVSEKPASGERPRIASQFVEFDLLP